MHHQELEELLHLLQDFKLTPTLVTREEARAAFTQSQTDDKRDSLERDEHYGGWKCPAPCLRTAPQPPGGDRGSVSLPPAPEQRSLSSVEARRGLGSSAELALQTRLLLLATSRFDGCLFRLANAYATCACRGNSNPQGRAASGRCAPRLRLTRGGRPACRRGAGTSRRCRAPP